MILYFNKTDIFSNKLKEFPLQKAFNDYNGGSDYEETIQFIRDLFIKITQENTKIKVFHCVTCTAEQATQICELIYRNDLVRNLQFGVTTQTIASFFVLQEIRKISKKASKQKNK